MEPSEDRATLMPETPKGIERIAATVPKQYALLLLLDGYPYVEMTARRHADFLTDLATWKRKTQPSLARSVVRYFLLAPNGEIKELAFNK
jgi:hypothetical protein